MRYNYSYSPTQLPLSWKRLMTARIASRQVDASDLKHDILNALVLQKGSMSPEQIANATSAELQTIIDALQEMTKRGFVKMASSGKYFAI